MGQTDRETIRGTWGMSPDSEGISLLRPFTRAYPLNLAECPTCPRGVCAD